MTKAAADGHIRLISNPETSSESEKNSANHENFGFRRRKDGINWRLLSAVAVEKIIREAWGVFIGRFNSSRMSKHCRRYWKP
jgi:hypothetical protein